MDYSTTEPAIININGQPMQKNFNTGEFYSSNAAPGRDSNLSAEEYRVIEQAIIFATAEAVHSGRALFGTPRGPLGLGCQSYGYDAITRPGTGVIDMTFVGHKDLTKKARTNIDVPIVQQNFFINRRDLEASRKAGKPLDTLEVMAHTHAVEAALEAMLIDGWTMDGTNYTISGLYQSAGNTEGTAKDFGTAGNAISKMGLALAVMKTDGMVPPFNLTLADTQWGELVASTYSTGVSEYDLVKNLIKGEIYSSSNLSAGTGMLTCTPNRGFFQMVMGVDLNTEYWDHGNKGTEGCIYLTAAPVIPVTNAICTLTSI